MKKVFFGIVLYIFLNFVFVSNIFSWDDGVTHKDLSRYAAESSKLSKSKGDYMKKLGYNKELLEEFKWDEIKMTVTDWLQDGATLEDAGSKLDAVTGKARFNNHFHNPLKPWAQAGLDDWIGFLHYTGESSLLWAQDGINQQNIIEGDWSWQKTRLCYYTALTVETEDVRQAFFACTFEGLGHQMHLLQDTSVPDHVRNDAHPEDALFGKNLNGNPYFESWAKNENFQFSKGDIT